LGTYNISVVDFQAKEIFMLARRNLAWFCATVVCVGGIAWAEVPATQPDVDAKMAAMQSQMQQMQSALQQTQSQLQQTQSQLKQTQSQLQQTQSQQTVNYQEEQQAIQEVLKESQQHSLMLSNGPGTAGYDSWSGFYIQSDDGQTVLHPGILFDGDQTVQMQGHFHGEDATGLVQLNFDGSLLSKDLTYLFLIDEGGGPAVIEESWAQYTFEHDILDNHDLSVRLGRIKDPAYKETSIIADPNQLFTDGQGSGTSQASNLVGGGWANPQLDGGELVLGGDDTPIHGNLAVAGGPALNTVDALGDDLVSQGILVSGRVDWKQQGDWRDTNDMTGRNLGQSNLLDFGAGAEALDTGNDGGVKAVRGTLDAQYQQAQQWTAFAALYGDVIGIYSPAAQIGDRDDFGATVQGGYDLCKPIQLIGVYSITCIDHRHPINGATTFQEIAGGLNYFLGPDGSWGNHAKFTFELAYCPNGFAPSALAVASTKSQLFFVGQFQLWL
jgi:hypothetical protein